MYSGNMLNELMDIVARAEEHAKALKAAELEVALEPYAFYASPYAYDGATQHELAGVA